MVAPLQQGTSSKMYEDEAEARLPSFQESSEEDFSLWELSVKAPQR